ncbi:Asp23/Gls24 family envelope stress response protein [Streptomyces sp. NRRL F-4474]|uniref:Asp23/Gls24 family envelope stress response protein n=1 Tax=Streptomyces sp. NRRL F-4474 TaxID=1463851 RepID=UPI00068BEA16|nr:Asp23/Gls24 family envelope stress response protein [Streptomyces sp. NRRL F-4474]
MAMNHPEPVGPPDEHPDEHPDENPAARAGERPGEHPGEEHVELLACGRDLAAVWEQTEYAGRPGHTGRAQADAHTLGCAHCREAVADLERLRTAALAPTTADAGGPPDASALVRRVMDVVRLELRPGRTLPLGEADEDIWMYESVAARTVRAAAEEVPGVRAGSCRIAPPGGGVRGPVTVRLEVTVEYGHDLRATSEAVRRGAVSAARDRLGLTVSALDVTVSDLHDPAHRPQGATP